MKRICSWNLTGRVFLEKKKRLIYLFVSNWFYIGKVFRLYRAHKPYNIHTNNTRRLERKSER